MAKPAIKAADFRSTNPHVPKSYRIDDEFVCITNAENLQKANPKLTYTEGWCRFPKKTWGAHAWCQTSTGEIVDPYFEWLLGKKAETLEYKPATAEENPFE